MEMKYERLSSEIEYKINLKNKNRYGAFAFNDENVIRRSDNSHDCANSIRSPFIRDADKITNCPFFNRYGDKTQVFSFYKNDDITRRSLHVQLVSRIARTIGKALDLNLELIEAIALGHDIGHTPFGHMGEKYLNEIYYKHTKKHFYHNLHSVRVLDKIYPYNISLQTLDGILCHDGENELTKYVPDKLSSFSEFDRRVEECYGDNNNMKHLIPCTLEGCVVRISDIIAYLGKDRQDAKRAGIIENSDFPQTEIGKYNAEIINNMTVNIIENSYGKPYIEMDKKHFEALKQVKQDNYNEIYESSDVRAQMETSIKPMMSEIYEKCLSDLECGNTDSLIMRHHINYVNETHYKRLTPYEETEPNLLVVDYIAAMTDDYFIDLHDELFPGSNYRIEYKGYFDQQSGDK